ncbi:MAG: nodulation protein NfeD [Anaerolineales bacterium]|nr:nodulation protein NfeD [Anaerolineales bacterium]
MRKKILLTLLLMVFLSPGNASAAATTRVLWLTGDGAVSTVMTEYVERGVEQAGRDGYALIVLQLNTPGGQIDLMERIVTALRESPVPVVVYVAPRGAMAGSAGTLITLAGHIAAMAPETAIGAASPVGSQGEDLNETLAAKEKEILSALVRALTERRGAEAVALAESMIQNAKAVSSSEALEAGLIDIIAESREDLLRQLDGRTVRLAGGEATLRTGFAAVDELDLSIIEILLGVLTNPNIVFILLAIGVQAILIELSSPGGWVAGFIGAVCLALAFYGMGLLTVNWLGLAFIVLAFILFFMEFQTPTHGALTAAGAASFIAGALILFNSPVTPEFQRVSVPLVIGTGVSLAVVFSVVIGLALRTRRLPPAMGIAALVGKPGEVREALEPKGTVQAEGELWSAESEDGTMLAAGERVEIVRIEGLRLIVRKNL